MSPYTKNLQKRRNNVARALSLDNIHEPKFWIYAMLITAAVFGLSYLILISQATMLSKDINKATSLLDDSQQKLKISQMTLAEAQAGQAFENFATQNNMISSAKFEYAQKDARLGFVDGAR